MGGQQFGQQVDNTFIEGSLDTNLTANTANQLDLDVQNEDVSGSDYETGEKNISGGQALNIIAQEESGNNADVIVEWTDGTGSVIASQKVISGLNSDTDNAALRVKSTHCNVKITGSSTDTSMSVNVN